MVVKVKTIQLSLLFTTLILTWLLSDFYVIIVSLKVSIQWKLWWWLLTYLLVTVEIVLVVWTHAWMRITSASVSSLAWIQSPHHSRIQVWTKWRINNWRCWSLLFKGKLFSVATLTKLIREPLWDGSIECIFLDENLQSSSWLGKFPTWTARWNHGGWRQSFLQLFLLLPVLCSSVLKPDLKNGNFNVNVFKGHLKI